MYVSQHIVLVRRDEIIAAVDGPQAPCLQLYNADLVGGPVTIQFGSGDNPREGLEVLHRVEAELLRVRSALAQRFAGRWPIAVAVAGAGDPEGRSPDAPPADG